MKKRLIVSRLSTIFEALQWYGIEETYARLLKSSYTNAAATLHINDDTVTVNIREGVQQGDAIWPKLFSAALEEIFERPSWE